MEQECCKNAVTGSEQNSGSKYIDNILQINQCLNSLSPVEVGLDNDLEKQPGTSTHKQARLVPYLTEISTTKHTPCAAPIDMSRRLDINGDTWDECSGECLTSDNDLSCSEESSNESSIYDGKFEESPIEIKSISCRNMRKRKLNVEFMSSHEIDPVCKKSALTTREDEGSSYGSSSLTLSPSSSRSNILSVCSKADDLMVTDSTCTTGCHATSATRLPTIPAKPNCRSLNTKENLMPDAIHFLNQFEGWSNITRTFALNGIIERCTPSEVRHIMQIIEPQFQRDFISLLPRELALKVLSFLDPRDLLTAAQTCKNWLYLAEDNLLWKEKCKQVGIVDDDVPFKRTPVNNPNGLAMNTSQWKVAYMRQHTIEMNWRKKPIKPPKMLKGHDDHVITCLQFCGNRIVSGSDDNTLKVWSAVTGKCLRTLVGHTGGVWSSQMSGATIISGSTDRTLKVWDTDTGVCLHTLYGHTSTVRCMHLHGKKVVSGSRDATLRVWNIESGVCLHLLVGHLAAVRCVQYDGKLVVSGAYDYMVKVWHPEREECLHTLQGHTNRVYSLQFDGIHVVSGSLDTSIRVWEVDSGTLKHTLMGHQSLTSGMELKNNILVSGNADSTVKVWDILNGRCLQTLSGPFKHQSAVTCLQFNSRFVITSSDDGTVKLWDVRTGEFIRNLIALDSGGSGGVVWRIRATDTKLVCAVGSRNGTEETKLLVLDFDVDFSNARSHDQSENSSSDVIIIS